MLSTPCAFLDRREDPRVSTRAPLRVRAPGPLLLPEGEATLEELSATGVRLRSRLHLHPGQALVLRLPGQAQPLHAEVLWVKDRPAAWAASGRTWIAGCKFEAPSIGKARVEPVADEGPRRRAIWAKRAVTAVAVSGVLALLVLVYLRVASILGALWVG
jgi:hypothetical protein